MSYSLVNPTPMQSVLTRLINRSSQPNGHLWQTIKEYTTRFVYCTSHENIRFYFHLFYSDHELDNDERTLHHNSFFTEVIQCSIAGFFIL